MKRFFMLLLMFVTVGVYAQSNTLSIKYDDNVLNPVDTVYQTITYTPEHNSNSYFDFYLYITNNTDEAVTYNIWRSNMEMIDNAQVSMCLSVCYPPSVELISDINIDAHETNAFHISYYPYLDIGTSYISFRFTPETATETTDFSEITFAITTQTGTSIRNDVSVSELRAYPNPASEIVNIAYSYKGDASNVNLVVKNLMGATITSQAVPSNGNVVKLNISDFASGIYFYSIEADGRPITTKKLLVK